MVAREPYAGEAYRQPSESEPMRPVREAVAVLERLLRLLFPDPPPLDIITVENIVNRYPLTGLGAPALAAIEQSQRIVRARSDYYLTGLGEFHIGLIYLYWDDCRASANQFAVARQPWSLAGDTPAVCLSHYAQGLGLYHAYHNEAAMLQFGRAERLLGRPTIGPHAERLAALAKEMRPLLAVAQETLRESLWPKEQPTAETIQTGNHATPSGVTQPEPGADGQSEPPEMPPHRPEWARRVPMPISTLPGGLGETLRGPVPGHITTDDRFGWYLIAERRSDFLPSLPCGTWLLADREVEERPANGREYVVVGSAQAGLGSITVQPISHSSAVAHCYLGYRQADESASGASRLFLDDSGRPSAAGDMLVLAVVEGFWYGPEGLPAG